MGKRHKVTECRITVYADDDDNPDTVEVSEWRRRGAYHLICVADIGPVPLTGRQVDELMEHVRSAVVWITGDALALDTGRMV